MIGLFKEAPSTNRKRGRLRPEVGGECSCVRSSDSHVSELTTALLEVLLNTAVKSFPLQTSSAMHSEAEFTNVLFLQRSNRDFISRHAPAVALALGKHYVTSAPISSKQM